MGLCHKLTEAEIAKKNALDVVSLRGHIRCQNGKIKDLRAENERLNKIIVDVVKQRDEAEHAMTNHEIRANDIEKKLEERQAEIDEMRKTWVPPVDDMLNNEEQLVEHVKISHAPTDCGRPCDDNENGAFHKWDRLATNSLKPCPVCGCKHPVHEQGKLDCWFVYCPDCCVNGPTVQSGKTGKKRSGDKWNAMPRRESLYPSPRQPSEAFFAQNVETEQMANDRKLADAVRKLMKDGRLSLYEKWHPMFASRKMPLTSEQDLIEAAKEQGDES